MYLYTELSAYIFNDALIECDNLLASCASSIDKHKRLTVVYASPSERCALPSALFYHPSCGNLDMLVVNYIMRHSLVLCGKTLVYVTANNGVHKETAGIAHHLRVGQFGLAYLNDGMAQLFGCRRYYALGFKRMANVAIVKIGSKCA